jgi:hypothetical protein
MGYTIQPGFRQIFLRTDLQQCNAKLSQGKVTNAKRMLQNNQFLLKLYIRQVVVWKAVAQI